MFKPTRVLAALLALSILVIIPFSPRSTSQAAPRDGVYHIAVLDVGNSFDWADDDFSALSASEYEWEMIDTGDFPSSLAAYDVLIIPWDHDYDWLTSEMADIIMEFVNRGGTLIIHSVSEDCGGDACESALPAGFNDALLDYFPADYFIEWVDESANSVLIIDPAHALASQPNVLTEDGLSDWGSSIHSYVVAWGAAWHWVLATDFLQGGPGAVPASQQGDQVSAQEIEPGVDIAMIQACAPYGAGVIVVSGQDPEYHGTNGNNPETFLQIENEIKIGDVGCGNTPQRDSDRSSRPSIGAGLSGLFQGQPTPLPTAPSAVAPAATAPSPITPPRTGDAGLADKPTGLFGVAIVSSILTMAIGARLVRR